VAAARRAAVWGGLLQASPDRAELRNSCVRPPENDTLLVDDLAALLNRCDAASVSEAALACAAAGSGDGLALVAAALYAARLHLQAAGLGVEQRPAQESMLQVKERPRRAVFATTHAALAALEQLGKTTVFASRALLAALDDLDDDSATAAVRRFLVAAYLSDGGEHFVRALAGAPYRVDPIHLRLAARCLENDGKTRPPAAAMSVRSATALAVAQASVRETAVAAAADMDRAAALANDPGFSLARALEQAQGEVCGRSAALQDERFSLLSAAAACDRVWSATAAAPAAALRIAAFLEAVDSRRVSPALTAVARPAHASSQPSASLRLRDEGASPVVVDAFLASLELDEKGTSAFVAEPVDMVATIDASLRAAAADSGLEAPAPAPWTWPQPEAAAQLTAAGMTFSASRLNAFVKCPRRWYYEYLCGVLDDSTSMQSSYGRVMHAALEALHRDFRIPSDHEPVATLERLLLELDLAFGSARYDFASQLEYEVARSRARRMAAQYVRWLDAQARKAPLEILHVESLHRFRLGGHQFVGYIDRIDRPLSGGPVTIFDYKTGRIDSDAIEYLKRVRRGEEAQLALYYAMRKDQGDDIARIALISLRDPRDEVWILALDITNDDGSAVIERNAEDGVLRAACSRLDLAASLDALLARCDQLTSTGFEHFPAGVDPPCDFCEYARACRDRPVAGERIFAR